MNLQYYDYFLPEKNLALEPAVPRDSSKLFIYETAVDKITFDHFNNLDKYLPKKSFMVMNNTKVLPARVTMTRLRQGFDGRGKIVVLFLINELTKTGFVKVLVDRKVEVGDKLYFNSHEYVRVVGQNENIFELEYDFSKEKLFELLNKYGTMPIPPYLKRSQLTRDELLEKYQTIFAKTEGSSAAPTASLHFTDSVFRQLDKKDIKRLFITLHVGMGTFAPITDENIKLKKLHKEYYEIDKKTLRSIDRLKSKDKKLVAVGTTVTRTLESVISNQSSRSSQLNPLMSAFVKTVTESVKSVKTEKDLIQPITDSTDLTGSTDLFIFPPFDFKMVDIMITNFHLPKSSLMMLVEAFLQHKGAKRHLVDLYNIAIKNNFQFYSFGDAMLIL